jgi:NAD(P)-dependent dehydrogenase (short-subunit alcohol dehydrogenase family)
MEIAGKAALVTGGGSGIGRATAIRLAADGASVLIVDLDQKMGEESVKLIEQAKGKAAWFKADVTDTEQMRHAMETSLEKFGRFDILHNNAGIAGGADFIRKPVERWRKVLDIDLQAVILGCFLAYPIMEPRGGGVIVNTASMAGIYPFPLDPVYAAAKGGVVHLTFSLTAWAKRGIRVNCVCPGVVDTPLLRRQVAAAEKKGKAALVPATTMHPDRIAEAVEMFVRDDTLIGKIVEVRPAGPRFVDVPRAPGQR